ncbi:MAG TPA: indolepyruvate ferredoxin oxidoreductase family protein, partial [Geminicoccaceae bacterium]|nr:indolepyruvate ferredoxin oxidoreductase family protein [Geminicoccaceae bacterium]
TSIWGSQQVGLARGAKYDGVFAMWYGKGPGVDRTGDVFKHANAAGTSRHGGVLALAGDDHACKSSTLPHQSEHEFIAALMPVLHPANVQEILDYGLYGWALSRFSGLWVAFKVIADTADSSASVDVAPDRVRVVTPEGLELPPGGLGIRWPDDPMPQEERLHRHKPYAALAFHRANGLDRIVIDSPRPRLGIATVGKSYLDVRQALSDLGISDREAADVGIRLYKVAMPWPLEPEGVRAFAKGLEEILVVEEKRAVIENQIKEQLYNWAEPDRPRVVGKFDLERNWLLPSTGELGPDIVARAIAARLRPFHETDRIRERIAFLDAKRRELEARRAPIARTPYFCSGCPHNTSTRVPEGSRALAGIGCHYMALWMDRSTETFTQMGGEGAPWIGQAPFTEEKHVFANLGDGTYTHSGLLAIRAAVAAEVNITYKILFNDAVAMTGGQPAEGHLTVSAVTRQVWAEGVRAIRVVTDEPEKYRGVKDLAPGTTVHHRDDLDAIQRELRGIEGTTVMVYDQTCATEKRRRRKRGTMADPDTRVVINELVCEGCGDCSVQSNCLSVEPVDTEFGRKRRINQSTCNKDYSCLKGFCPSFVTVKGGRLRRPKAVAAEADGLAELPEPTALPELREPYDILVTGVGGTGVVTISALLGMAAHLEGKGCGALDQTGLAQKYGAVTSHVRIAARPADIHAVRIADGNADLLLGCDLVVSAGADALAKVRHGRTHAVINAHETPTAAFVRSPDLDFRTGELRGLIADAVGRERASFVDATDLGLGLTGDAIAANVFLLGYAWQKGLVPVSREAMERAIELNGVAVDFNKRAFAWGRLAASRPEEVEALASRAAPEATGEHEPPARTFEEVVERRVRFLTAYQSRRYARKYREFVERVRAAERERTPGREGLGEAVARYLFKLMAYKDEYEVARLYTGTGFLDRVRNQFEGDYRLEFHLAPPALARRDPRTGHPRKRAFGPWVLRAFGVLTRFRFLRGTPLDPFGRAPERRTERRLIGEYRRTVDGLLADLNHDNHGLAVEIARIPEQIRGYGHVKERHLAEAKRREAELL